MKADRKNLIAIVCVGETEAQRKAGAQQALRNHALRSL